MADINSNVFVDAPEQQKVLHTFMAKQIYTKRQNGVYITELNYGFYPEILS